VVAGHDQGPAGLAAGPAAGDRRAGPGGQAARLDRPVKAELAVEVTVTGSIESELSSLAAELALNDFVAIEAEVVEPG
jgi:hypothetical protein